MTSMIDVIFLLLVFFVFTADFDRLEKLLPMNLSLSGKVERIETPKTEEIEPTTLKIRIFWTDNARAAWQIGSERLTEPAALANAVAQTAPRRNTTSVIIAPEGNVPIEKVLDVYDLCRGAGLNNIQFTAKKL